MFTTAAPPVLLRFIALSLLTPLGLFAPPLHAGADISPPSQPAASPYPLQLEISVPYAPSAFVSAGQPRLVYELVLRNFETHPLELLEIAVLDGAVPNATPIAVYDSTQLPALIRRVGGRTEQPGTQVPNGGSVTVYLLLSFDAAAQVPSQLQHRVRTSRGGLITAPVTTRQHVVPVLGAPVTGTQWLAETGLSNDNGHRRGNMLHHGHSVISRRYAFDWVQVENGAMYSGDEKLNTSYFGYGEALVAVSDGVVVSVVDSVPENIPGRTPIVPITLDNTAGNSVVLDIGNGQYAHYMHLKDGSLRVQAGNHVRRGQVLGVIGNSGDSFAPHLHFEVTTSPQVLAGEGVPYVIESFEVLDGGGAISGKRDEELPLEKMLVDFGD